MNHQVVLHYRSANDQEKSLIYARQRTNIIQNMPKAKKKAQIRDKQAARLTNHFALGLDPINSSCPQSKPRPGK